MALSVRQNVVISSPTILNGEKLQALVHEISDKGIMISIPIEGITCQCDSDITLNFWDDKATYSFLCRILTSKGKDDQFLTVSKPLKCLRVFNREHQRVLLESDGQIQKADSRDINKCCIMDLSRGGTRVRSQIKLEAKEFVKLHFVLKERTFENLSGKVVWRKSLENEHFEYGIQFDLISNIRRNELDAFIQMQIAL